MYAFFLGNDLSLRYTSPLREPEKTPSLSLYTREGELLWKDHGKTTRPKGGDAFSFVVEYYKYKGHDFNSALRQFNTDFMRGYSPGKINPPESSTLTAVYNQNFEQYELDYWATHGVAESLLISENIHKVVTITKASGQVIKRSTPQRPCFLYNFISGWKSYSPLAPKKYRFLSQNLSGLVEGLATARSSEIGIISSSTKDRLTVKGICGLDGVNPVSENALKTLLEKKEEIESLFNKIYVIFDGDETGIASANDLCEDTGWEAIHLDYPEGTKDPADVVLKYGQDTLKDLMWTQIQK